MRQTGKRFLREARLVMTKTTRFVLTATWVLGLACAAIEGQSASSPIQVNIDTRKTAEPVSKYVFGMFIEHIGKTMYGPLWAEMLDDRKFYFAISSKQDETPPQRGGGPGRMPLRKWRPVGPDEIVVMDRQKPFVGEQSPRIQLE